MVVLITIYRGEIEKVRDLWSWIFLYDVMNCDRIGRYQKELKMRSSTSKFT